MMEYVRACIKIDTLNDEPWCYNSGDAGEHCAADSECGRDAATCDTNECAPEDTFPSL